MKWYYVEAGQQMGPVDDATLAVMAASGRIAADTLVWKEGMANWQPYSEVAPAGQPGQAGPAPTVAGGGEVVCAECGQLFPATETIRIGEARVCANCKPTFVQKMREGLTVGNVSMRYAGFWIRFGAKILDGFILGCFLAIPMVFLFVFFMRTAVPTGGPSVGSRTPPFPNAVGLFFQLIALAIQMCYATYFVGKFGATPGKMLCKIHVVDASGEKIGFGRAFGRFWAEILSGLTCYIGYIIAGFDDEKRALHDRICNTRVVYK